MAAPTNTRLPSEAEAYYNEGMEQTRLFSASGQLEFLRTTEIIARYLPAPPATVLDIGGAAGNYAFWLAERNYTAHLVDLMPLHIEQANLRADEPDTAPLASISLGDARNLEFAGDSVQGILLLGPLYHLTERAERIQALREAHRVLAPGGLLFAVGISRFASALDGLFSGFMEDEAFRQMVSRDLIDGQHRNPTTNSQYFTTTFLHHPDELRAEIVEAGFALEAVLAIEGPGWLLPDLAERWDDEAGRDTLLETIRKIESDASIIGASAHILGVGRKG